MTKTAITIPIIDIRQTRIIASVAGFCPPTKRPRIIAPMNVPIPMIITVFIWSVSIDYYLVNIKNSLLLLILALLGFLSSILLYYPLLF